nr:MAG TPA: hypothetical protein [Bacteriophage sp.]
MELVYNLLKRIVIIINVTLKFVKCLDYCICIHNITTYIFTCVFTHQEINCSCTNILGTMYLHTYQRCLNKIFLHYI